MSVVVEAAGGGSIRFHDIEDPREVHALVDRRAGVDGEWVPGSVEQWEAVFDAVRAWRAAIES